jgi:hypothetical protein
MMRWLVWLTARWALSRFIRNLGGEAQGTVRLKPQDAVADRPYEMEVEICCGRGEKKLTARVWWEHYLKCWCNDYDSLSADNSVWQLMGRLCRSYQRLPQQ